MELKLFSSLDKIFPDSLPRGTAPERFVMLANERFSFQIGFYADAPCELPLATGGTLSGVTKTYLVECVPVNLAAYENSDDYYLRKTPGLYPDVLMPVSGSVKISSAGYRSVFVEICGDGSLKGRQSLTVGLGGESVSVDVDIIDALLPAQELVYTNWFHGDCLCDYYGVRALSDDFYRICGNFISAAASHGMNCVLTPLFTPALDTAPGGERTTVQLVEIKSENPYTFDFSQVERWIEMCRGCGIKYFEMSPFFTQWGAEHAPKIVMKNPDGTEKKLFGWETDSGSGEYESFLRQFGAALCAFIESHGLSDSVFFHISDEPGMDQLETYKKRAALIREIFGRYKIFDAMSDYEFYELGAVDIPVASESSVEKFAGRVPELWTYYCCGQGDNYLPNRFMAMPSLRSRILGALLFKYDCRGFLQWGCNFYNTQLSLERINPFEVTDAGGAFPSGDAFVLYPGEGGDALCSLRLKVFNEALQDLRALKLLESLCGRQAALEFTGDITFTSYPRDEAIFYTVREKIYEKIARM